MRQPLAIRGHGLRTAAGFGLETLRASVAEGRTALAELPTAVARGLPHTLGGRAPGLPADSQRGLLLARDVIEAALAGVPGGRRARIPLLVGTGLGPQEPREAGQSAQAQAFSEALAVGAGLDVAQSLTYSVTCVSGLCALERARRALAGGAPAALVLGVETLSRTIQGGFCALEALSATASPSEPSPQDGIVLGEAACALLLEPAEPGEPALLGQGLVADACHATSPDRSGRGMREAIEVALSEAGLGVGDLGWIALTAAGSPVYAATYAGALDSLWGSEAWRERVVDWEGSVGHLLAASGPVGLLYEVERARETPGLALTVGFGGLNGASVVGPARAAEAVASREVRVLALASASEGAQDLEDAFPGRWDPRRRIPPEVAPLAEAARQALAGLGRWEPGQVLPDLGIVIAVDNHGERAAQRFGSALERERPCSPAVFLNSLPSTPATTLSLLFGARGYQATLNAGSRGGAAALEEARWLVSQGVVPTVLAGALSVSPAGNQSLAALVLVEEASSEQGSECVHADTKVPAELAEQAVASFLEAVSRSR
jgi:3-oxoacyl-(acyl-carrier-protein) synthase